MASTVFVLVTAWASIAFTRGSEHVAAIWLANAILLVALLKSRTSAWPVLLASGYAASVVANINSGNGPQLTLALPACNVFEVSLIAVTLRWRLRADIDLSRLDHLCFFILVGCVAAPSLSGVFATGLFSLRHATPHLAVWLAWYSAHALGLLVLTPLLLMLRVTGATTLLSRRQRLETIAWFAVLSAITVITFSQSAYPLLFLPIAVLGVIAVRLGPTAMVLSIGLVTIIATVATFHGFGPMMLVPGSLSTRTFVLQGFVAVTVLSKLPLTALLTAQARLEAKTREATMRLMLAERIAQVGHWHWDLVAHVLTWSDEVYRMHGLDRATYTPTLDAAIEAYHPDDRAAVKDSVAHALEAPGDYEIAARLIRTDGGVRDVVSRGQCETDPDGRVMAIFGTIMDVTALRQAERAVAESEARYRLLADHSSDLIALKPTFAGPRAYVSPSARSVFGYEPDEFAALPAAEFIHPDDQEMAARHFQSLTAEHPQVALIHRCKHKAGHWLWTDIIFTLANAGRADQGVIVRARDITARYEAEHALAASEARYRLLADNVSDLIVLGHADGRRIYISPAVKAMLGYTVEEAHRIRMRDWVHPDDLATVFAATQSLSDTRQTASVTYRLRHQNGHYIWAEAAFKRVEEDGQVTIVTAIRDVTERIAQAELLNQAKVAAEAGARIKAEFLANMSHELRTPLTGMLGVHDLLHSDPTLSTRQSHLVSLAQESGRSLLRIVNDILDFSKIEAGQMAIERVPFSLRELIESCRRLGFETVRTKDISLAIGIERDVPDLLLGDTTRVRQVLLNLVSNAVKFTPKGTVTIRATWPSDRLRIDVTDTGIGIPDNVIPQLFERFIQADGTTARRFGGTGLGLSISKRLVEMMGGEIGVESTPGRGSTFWFALPLERAEIDRRQARHDMAPAADAVRRRTILVAEDNEINQEIIRTVLLQKGHEVTMVGDGAAAVDAFLKRTFDIVLMDVQMPGTDGLEATALIRTIEAHERRRPTPVVALTANAMAEETERCRRAGMNAHVAKPIDWTELFATIDHHCPDPPSHDARDRDETGAPQPLALDEEMLDDLATIVGRDQIGDLLTAFGRELERRLTLIDAARLSAEDLGAHAHALVSFAGQLGFQELSTLCMELEAAALAGGGLERVGHLRSAADRALRAAATSTYARAA